MIIASATKIFIVQINKGMLISNRKITIFFTDDVDKIPKLNICYYMQTGVEQHNMST